MNKHLNALLSQYSADHENPYNQLLHKICVPLIYWAIVAMLWAIPPFIELPFGLSSTGILVMITFLISYYLTLSVHCFLIMFVFTLLCFLICMAINALNLQLTPIACAIFVVAWAGQFIGHIYEGRKPSFFTEIQFLFIGPLWVLLPLSSLYKINE